MSFLSSSQFNTAATLLMLVLASAAVYFAWTGPRRKTLQKELSFGIIYRGVLVAAAKSVLDDVSMTYNGHKVTRVSVVIVSIMNTGQLPIAISDFEKPARLVFKDVEQIFSAMPLRCSPTHLAPTLTQTKTEVFLAPVLLNPGDFLTLRVIVENTGRVRAALEARIAGIAAYPILRAGPHPGYKLGSLIYWSGMTLATLAFCIFMGWSKHYWLAAIYSLFPILLSLGVSATLRDIIHIKRSRWMGNNTKDLGEEGLGSCVEG